MDQIGVGIIGSGSWGRRLAAGYLDAERKGRVKLVKVCDNSVAALGALLLDHKTVSIGEDRLSFDIRDIIESPEVSAVHVATPCQTHGAFVRMALEAGKNVLAEPISPKSPECYELIDLAAEKGLVIEGSNYGRFNRAVEKASNIVKSGDLGRIQYIGIQWTDAGRLTERDVLFELGPGPIEILNLMLGTWPRDVSGVSGTYRDSKYNELVRIFAQYPNDVSVHIELNGLHPRKINEVFVVGSSTTLDVDCSNQRIVEYSSDKRREIPITPSDTIACEIDHFLDKILHGDIAVDPATIQTVETLEDIQSSLWTSVPTINRTDMLQKSKQSEMASLETAVGLLEIVHKGSNKTPIINDGELNPDLVRRYFMMLEKIGLVESWDRSNQEKAYSMTTKGLQFLIDYYESRRLGEITDNTRRILQAVGLGTI